MGVACEPAPLVCIIDPADHVPGNPSVHDSRIRAHISFALNFPPTAGEIDRDRQSKQESIAFILLRRSARAGDFTPEPLQNFTPELCAQYVNRL